MYHKVTILFDVAILSFQTDRMSSKDFLPFHKLVSSKRMLVLRKGFFVFLALVQFLCVPLAPRAAAAIQEANLAQGLECTPKLNQCVESKPPYAFESVISRSPGALCEDRFISSPALLPRPAYSRPVALSTASPPPAGGRPARRLQGTSRRAGEARRLGHVWRRERYSPFHGDILGFSH